MKKFEKITALLVLIGALAGVIISRVDQKYFEGIYVKEDALIEWLTVVALLFGAGLCFYRFYLLRAVKKKFFLFATFVLGLLFIFGAGEEISWGQRLLGIHSPEFFINHNTQYEMNFHNLVIGGVRINKLVFGLILSILVGSYFLLLPLFYRKVEKVRFAVDYLALPIPRISHIFLYLVLALLVYLIPSPKKGEILEFGGCWIFFLMTLNPYNISNFRVVRG